MKSKDVGLPIEYQQYPEYFDIPSHAHHTDDKNKTIEKVLRKYKSKNVLDMTCGTGAQVFYLKNLGYQVIGSDFSPGLLEIARNKALKHNIANGIFTADEVVTIQKNKDQKQIKNKCSLQIYSMNDLNAILSKNSFKVIEQHKIDAYTFNQDDQGYSILTVAMKQ